mmetsp:Transcript_95231/g.159953  ORF Transcript_95231/g.159953 Transcript_95231/m.159953 type:complete len:97 (+) Transcript_95231:435-725(+)
MCLCYCCKVQHVIPHLKGHAPQKHKCGSHKPWEDWDNAKNVTAGGLCAELQKCTLHCALAIRRWVELIREVAIGLRHQFGFTPALFWEHKKLMSLE